MLAKNIVYVSTNDSFSALNLLNNSISIKQLIYLLLLSNPRVINDEYSFYRPPKLKDV